MTLPGFREFYPEDLRPRSFIQQTWKKVARSFAFEEYESPVLEPLELYTDKVGSELIGQLFHFVDKGDRAVALRPEVTASVARMVGARANALGRPAKWFNIGDQFRFERPQKGRLRCFTQLNADIFGESGPAAEAELIGLLVAVFERFGFNASDVTIRLSDRILWNGYLELLGYTDVEAKSLLQVVDRSAKARPEQTLEAIREILPNRDAEDTWKQLEDFKQVVGLSDLTTFCDRFSEDKDSQNPLKKRLLDWHALLSECEDRGINDFVKIDLNVVRGIAYYTGFIFEAFPASGQGRALAGGGRYDHLIEKVAGQVMPAVGFGMGDVTLTDLLVETKKMPPFVAGLDAWAIGLSDESYSKLLQDAHRLRMAGLIVDYALSPKGGLGKQLKTAEKKGAQFALIYGDAELEKGVVQIRDLRARESHDVPRQQLLDWLCRS